MSVIQLNILAKELDNLISNYLSDSNVNFDSILEIRKRILNTPTKSIDEERFKQYLIECATTQFLELLKNHLKEN